MITEKNVIQLFLQMVPEQQPRVDDYYREFNEGFEWFLFGAALVKYLTNIYCSQNANDELLDQAERILDFIESGLVEGDKYVQELMMFGFLEKLESSIPCYETIKSNLKPKSLENLQLVDDFWSEKLS
jgi:hypothetical protein